MEILYISLTAIFGLCIGSFLNVVIHRLPIIMQRNWRSECIEFMNLPEESQSETFNLLVPRSQCPKCKKTIMAWQNIPNEF